MPKKKEAKNAKTEVYAAKSTIYIPANKQSAWVYKKGTKIVKDHNKEHQGLWSFPGYTIESKNPVEVWVFRDSDPEPIEESVLSNNPLQGVWGYVNNMENPRHPKPEEMIFYPPDSKHPQSFKVRGVWVKPMYKRDMSALAPNSTGFMKMSDVIEATGPHGVGGTWKVLGSNQIKGRDKNQGGDDDNDDKNRWTIYIRRPRGERKTFPLAVIPGNRLSQVKEKIKAEKDIPVENQRLFFKGEPLKDEKTLVGSGVRNGDTIDLGPMDIFIRTPRGKKFKFEVDPREMVEDVKKIAEPKVGMPVPEQRLRFKRVHINDGNPISKYGITHGSVLDLARMVIFVEPLSSWGLPTVELDVEKTDTIKSVKTKVKNRINIQPEEQNLFFEGTYLDKMISSLEDYNIKHMDILVMQDNTPDNPGQIPRVSKPKRSKRSLSPKKLGNKPSRTRSVSPTHSEDDDDPKVTIRPPAVDGPPFDIPIDPEDTVKDLKRKVGKKLGRPPRSFEMIPEGNDEPAKNPDKIIPGRTYSIDPPTPPDELEEESNSPSKINIKPPKGRAFPMEIDPENDTIDDVKREVAKKIGKPPRQFTLINDDTGEPIPGNKNPTPNAQYSIGPPSDDGPIEVQLRRPNGRVFTLLIDPDRDLDDVKEKAAKHIGFPVKHVRLIDEDGQEPNGNTKPRSNRVYELVPPQIEVTLPDDTKIEIDILPKQKVGDIKDIIEDVSGIPKAKQRVFFLDSDDELIDDEIPVFKTKLAHGVKLETKIPKEIILNPPKGMGRPFTLIVDPDDTFKDTARKAGKLIGFPAKHLRLTDEGEEPEQNSKPKCGRAYQIEPPEIQVKLPDGSKVCLDLMPKQTIADIKERLQDEIGTPVSEQRLFFLDCDEELNEKTPVFKTKLGHGSVLEMKCPQEVVLKPPKGMGRPFTLIVDLDDTLKDVKRKAAKHIGFPAKYLRLVDDDSVEPDLAEKPKMGVEYQMLPPEVQVALPNDKHIDLDILPKQTIGDIKDIISEQTGIPKSKQRIFFLDGEDELDDNLPIHKTKIKHGSKLEMKGPDEITVRPPKGIGRDFILIIDPEDTIDDVKRKAAKKIGFPAKHLRLLDESKEEPGGQSKPTTGMVYEMAPPQVQVELPDKSKIELEIVPQHTIADIKDIIEEKTGTPKSKQRIFFLDGDTMLDDETPISKTKIRHGSKMVMREVPETTIRTPDGRTFTLIFDHDNTEENPDKFKLKLSSSQNIGDLKDVIEKETGIPKDRHRFFYIDSDEEESAANDIPLSKTALVSGTQLEMRVPDPLKLRVKTPDGRSFFISLEPGDTPEDAKRKIAERIGVPPSSLQFSLNDDEPIDESLDFRCLSRGDVFCVEPTKLEVILPDDSRIVLEILPHHTIADIKDMIEEETGIPKAKQRAFFLDESKNEELDDDVPVVKKGLGLGIPLHLKTANGLEIPVKAPDGRNFILFVEPDDTVESAKRKLQKMGLPMKQLRLVDLDGEEMKDTLPVTSYNVREGQVLMLESPEIEIELPNQKRLKIKLLPNQTLADLKEIIEEKTGIPKANQRYYLMDVDGNELEDDVPPDLTRLTKGSVLKMREVDASNNPKVTFKTRDGRAFVLTIDPEETVKDVKKKLREKMGVMVGNFKLDDASFDPGDDDIFLDIDPSIRLGAVLVAEPPEIEVLIPETGKKVKVVILPTTTVSDVKKVIEEQIPEYKAKKQRLFFLDGEEEVPDDTPFVKLEIEKGVPLEVRPCQVIVKHWNGDTVAITVETTEYVGDLKDKISNSFKIPYDQQRLTFQGRPVRDDLTFVDQGIGDKSILQLKPMSITIVDPKGKSHEFLVESTDHIGLLKEMLVEKTSVPIELQCIMSGGKELEDYDSLEDAGISHGESLSLELFTISVMKWTGETFDVPGIKPTDTINKLKLLIQKSRGIPKSNQELLLNEVSLDDEETLEDEEVRHKSILVLVDPNDGDIDIPEQDLLSLNVLKKKRFGVVEEDIWPVLPDWKKRIFFFDNDETFSGLVEITIMNWTGKTFTLTDVPLRETVRQFQERIYKLKQIPVKEQHITFDGKRLDPRKTLRQQMVKDKSVLVLEGKNETNLELPDADKLSFGFLPNRMNGAISLNIEHWNGEIFRVDVQPTDYIDDLKDLIEKKMQIPVDHQRLLLQGYPVDEGDNLQDQKIGDGTILALEPMKIVVVAPGGKHHSVVVDFKDKIRKVKSKMYKKTGIDKRNQCLLSGGNELSDQKTLADYDIEHQDILTLETFKISIMHWSGEVFELQRIHRTQKLKAVKEEILNLKHISTKKQKLLYRGTELDKKKTLEEQGIEHKSILMLEKIEKESKVDKVNVSRSRSVSPLGRPKITFMHGFETPAIPKTDDTFKVQIRHWNGNSFEINSSPFEYPDDVKEKIEEEKGIPVDQLRLMYNGYYVHDDKTLQEQGIRSGSVLDLEKMRIVVEVPGGHSYHFEVEVDDTVRHIKSLVAVKAGSASLEDFCIVFGGEELAEGSTLAECGIEHEDVIALELFKISVMHWSGEPFELQSVRPDHTLDKVKGHILKSKLIPKEKQRLLFEGRELNDKKTLIDEKIHHKSIIVLERVAEKLDLPEAEKFKLNTLPTAGGKARSSHKLSIKHWDGSSFEIDTNPLEYSDDVKDKIRKARGMKTDDLRLIYQGTHLRDDATLQDQNIPSGAIIELEKMKVMVKLPGGKKSQFEVELDDTVRILKKFVAKKRKLDIDDICVMIGGKELDDGSTIEENGIHHDDVVNVEMYKISVIYGSGEKFDLESIRPSFTLGEVKNEISRIEQLPKERQRLLFNGRELSDKKTLRDQKVQHRSVLILEKVIVAEGTEETEKFKLSTFSTQIPQKKAKPTKLTSLASSGGESSRVTTVTSDADGSSEEAVEKQEKKVSKKKPPKRVPSKASQKSATPKKKANRTEGDVPPPGDKPKVRKKVAPGRTKSLQKPQATRSKPPKIPSRSKSESQKVKKTIDDTDGKTKTMGSKLKKMKKKMLG